MLKPVLSAAATLCLASSLVLSLASTAMAEGDAKAGKRVFNKCKACHTVKEGKNKTGPSLYKIIDAPSGVVEGFRYSEALASANLTWDAETLSAFLADPKATVPGNKMSFPGLKEQTDIDDVIAYILDKSN